MTHRCSSGPSLPGRLLFHPFPWSERNVTADSFHLSFHPSIVAHHRRSGQVFTQDQEEMILIGAFGLFWFGKSQKSFFFFFVYGIGPIFRECKVVPEGRSERRIGLLGHAYLTAEVKSRKAEATISLPGTEESGSG
jgi:hypothetical protein